MNPGPAGTMHRRPTVSVVVPAYNGCRWLASCLESVADQTRPPDQILVLDDCSSDDTVAVARGFTDRLPSLQIESNPRQLGPVVNHNRGLELCDGEWVKVMGQDDLLHPRCLELSLEAASEAPVVVCARTYDLAEAEPAYARRLQRRLALAITSSLSIPTRLDPDQLARRAGRHPLVNVIGEPVCILARAELMRAFPFDGAFVQMWDYAQGLRLALAEGAVFLPAPLATFRVHPSSASAWNNRQRRFEMSRLDPLRHAVQLLSDPALLPLARYLGPVGSLWGLACLGAAELGLLTRPDTGPIQRGAVDSLAEGLAAVLPAPWSGLPRSLGWCTDRVGALLKPDAFRP